MAFSLVLGPPRVPGVRQLFWHIFLELLSTFAISLGALLALILIGRLLSLRELFLSQSLGLLEIGRLLFYLSPFFLLLLLPIGCMVAVFLTFLRMSTDNELVALKAGGVSLYQLLPPVLAFCFLCLAANGWVSFQGLSWGMDHFRAEVLEFARTKTKLMLQPGVFNREMAGLTVFAEQFDAEEGKMRLAFVRDATRKGVTATILAPEGQVGTDTEAGQIVFVLRNGHIYRQTDKDSLDVLGFDSYMVRLDLSQLFRGYRLGELKPKEMSWERLQATAEDTGALARHGANFVRKVAVERHKRLALPVACLVLGLFSLPLACAFQGLKQYVGLLIALGCFMVYYTLLSLAFTLGESGVMAPAWGLWLPNVLFFLCGLAALFFVARERYPRVFDWLAHVRFERLVARLGARDGAES